MKPIQLLLKRLWIIRGTICLFFNDSILFLCSFVLDGAGSLGRLVEIKWNNDLDIIPEISQCTLILIHNINGKGQWFRSI